MPRFATTLVRPWSSLSQHRSDLCQRQMGVFLYSQIDIAMPGKKRSQLGVNPSPRRRSNECTAKGMEVQDPAHLIAILNPRGFYVFPQHFCRLLAPEVGPYGRVCVFACQPLGKL